MVSAGLYVRMEAKPGKEAEVKAFLKSGLGLVQEEAETVAWSAIRMGQTTFGIFDAFPNESGRQAHLRAGWRQPQCDKPTIFSPTPLRSKRAMSSSQNLAENLNGA